MNRCTACFTLKETQDHSKMPLDTSNGSRRGQGRDTARSWQDADSGEQRPPAGENQKKEVQRCGKALQLLSGVNICLASTRS